jgi:hypothetical protein
MKPGYQVKELITKLLFLICCNSFNRLEDILQFHKYDNYKISTPRYNSPQRCICLAKTLNSTLSLVFTHKIRKKKMPTVVAYVSGILL